MNEAPIVTQRQLLTAEQLAHALNLPSSHTIKVLARKRRIPVVKIGYRTHRYDLEKVREALVCMDGQTGTESDIPQAEAVAVPSVKMTVIAGE